ncbi:hypothetical protein V8E36_008204 [Tilletia maclaganii]
MSSEARHRGFVDEAGLFDPDELQRNPPLAATADIMKIYEEAVQEPLIEVTNLDSLYSQIQHEDTDRYDARILREDFCSTAIVANSWLSVHPDNHSQGVDIDLDALVDTQRRYGPESVRICQSPAFQGDASGASAKELRPIESTSSASQQTTANASSSTAELNAEASSSTWAPGAASDRFERKFQARQSQERAKRAKLDSSQKSKKSDAPAQPPRLTLLHSDVLDLPLSTAPGDPEIPPPDLIATLNYGLCYFHDRRTLVRYLSMCANTLRPRTGVLICDQWGGPATGESYPPDQEELWAQFEREVGFKRKRSSTLADPSSALGPNGPLSQDQIEAALLRATSGQDGLLAVYPAPSEESKGTLAEWPRGKLKLVRKGKQHGGFEYWREDGPIDYMTNRFRMGLSFRFSDGSWIRDFFSYDFRIWSLKEITEAMLEAGFARVSVHVLPRNVHDDADDSHSDIAMSSRPGSPTTAGEAPDHRRTSEAPGPRAEGQDDDDEGLADVGHMLRRTEKEEHQRAEYQCVEEGQKVFATRSFGSEFHA